MKKLITLGSHYGTLRAIRLLAEIAPRGGREHEVSYRQAVRAEKNNAGDCYRGLVIDRANKRAWIEMEIEIGENNEVIPQ